MDKLPDFDDNGYLPKNCYKPSLDEFKERFVNVDDINTRRKIFSKYEEYSGRFKSILMKVWVGGSYVTDKPKPNDIDLTVHFNTKKFNDLTIFPFTEKSNFYNRKYMKSKYKCHIMYVPVYPKDDIRHVLTKEQEKTWYKWFTKDRENIPKGIVELSHDD